MDNVPYAFIESVLTRLDENDLEIISDDRCASLWSTAARIHTEKLRVMIISLRIKENGNLCFNCQQRTTHNDNLEGISFNEMLQLDVRFVRISCLNVSNWEHDDRLELPVERLPELIRYFSLFRLGNLEIYGKCPNFLKLLENELSRNQINPKMVLLWDSPGMEGFLKNQLIGPNLAEVILEEESCSEEIREDLEAFMCSPQFNLLKITGKTPEFDFETLNRIADSWKRSPVKHAWVEVPTSGNLAEEFSALMEIDSDCEKTFREDTDDYSLEVVCSDSFTSMIFQSL